MLNLRFNPLSKWILVFFAIALLATGCTSSSSSPTPPKSSKAAKGTQQNSTKQASSSASDSPKYAAVSPKPGWSEFPIVEETPPASGWEQAALWLPNRLLDFWDIFRVDVGVGPSVGAVVRVSSYVQGGIRTMAPGSLRVGMLGRRPPVMFETSNEVGVSPVFKQSKDRLICSGETGVGVDLLLVGGYVGICWDEVFDFFTGIFLEDPKEDDFQ